MSLRPFTDQPRPFARKLPDFTAQKALFTPSASTLSPPIDISVSLGDVNRDQTVDGDDLVVVLGHLGSGGTRLVADVDPVWGIAINDVYIVADGLGRQSGTPFATITSDPGALNNRIIELSLSRQWDTTDPALLLTQGIDPCDDQDGGGEPGGPGGGGPGDGGGGGDVPPTTLHPGIDPTTPGGGEYERMHVFAMTGVDVMADCDEETEENCDCPKVEPSHHPYMFVEAEQDIQLMFSQGCFPDRDSIVWHIHPDHRDHASLVDAEGRRATIKASNDPGLVVVRYNFTIRDGAASCFGWLDVRTVETAPANVHHTAFIPAELVGGPRATPLGDTWVFYGGDGRAFERITTRYRARAASVMASDTPTSGGDRLDLGTLPGATPTLQAIDLADAPFGVTTVYSLNQGQVRLPGGATQNGESWFNSDPLSRAKLAAGLVEAYTYPSSTPFDEDLLQLRLGCDPNDLNPPEATLLAPLADCNMVVGAGRHTRFGRWTSTRVQMFWLGAFNAPNPAVNVPGVLVPGINAGTQVQLEWRMDKDGDQRLWRSVRGRHDRFPAHEVWVQWADHHGPESASPDHGYMPNVKSLFWGLNDPVDVEESWKLLRTSQRRWN